jgi:RNA polymerase sigma factor (sigma-70 family)
MGDLGRDIRTLFDVGRTGVLSDRELLERFTVGRDEAAFAALLDRHGPTVWRVCRGLLADPHDAQDAFQATFLVLVRRAGSIRDRESLGNWLFGVARRVSLRAIRESSRRRRREQRVARVDLTEDRPADDLSPVLLSEVDRLPPRLRSALVLCDLEGRSYGDAAVDLGCPVGTVRSRLSRARDTLRRRLERRGLTGAASTPLVAACRDLPFGLAAATRSLASGSASSHVTTLAAGVLHTMFLSKLIPISTLLVLATALGAAGTYFAKSANEPAPTPPEPAMPSFAPDRPSELVGALKALDRDADGLKDPIERGRARQRIAVALVKAGDPAAARDVAHRALKDAKQGPDGFWQTYVRTEIATALMKAGARDQARAEFDALANETSLITAGLARADTYVRLAAARHAADPVDVGEVRSYLRKAEDSLEKSSDNERLNGLMHIVREYARLGEPNEALRPIAALPDEQSNWKDPLVREVLQVFEAEGKAPPEGLLQMVERLVMSIKYEIPRACSQTELAIAWARAGDMDRALMTARTIGKYNKQFDDTDSIPLALAGIARELVRRGDLAGAANTAHEAQGVAMGLRNDDVIRPERLRRVAEAQALADDLEGATRSIEAIANNYEKTYGLVALGVAQAKKGDLEAARGTFRKAVDSANQIGKRESLIGNDPVHDTVNARHAIVDGYCQTRLFDEANSFIAETGSDDWKNSARGALAGALARARKFDEAKAVAAAITDANIRGQVQAGLASEQVEAGDLQGVIAWAATLDSVEARSQVLSSAARAR